MKDKEFMQIYCAALNGLIIAQGRNDLLTEDYTIQTSLTDVPIPEVRFARKQAENNQIDLISGLTDVANLIAIHSLITLEME